MENFIEEYAWLDRLHAQLFTAPDPVLVSRMTRYAYIATPSEPQTTASTYYVQYKKRHGEHEGWLEQK